MLIRVWSCALLARRLSNAFFVPITYYLLLIAYYQLLITYYRYHSFFYSLSSLHTVFNQGILTSIVCYWIIDIVVIQLLFINSLMVLFLQLMIPFWSTLTSYMAFKAILSARKFILLMEKFCFRRSRLFRKLFWQLFSQLIIGILN